MPTNTYSEKAKGHNLEVVLGKAFDTSKIECREATCYYINDNKVTDIKQINDNILILTKFNNQQLSSDGYFNLSLSGQYLIKFYNSVVKINRFTYENNKQVFYEENI